MKQNRGKEKNQKIAFKPLKITGENGPQSFFFGGGDTKIPTKYHLMAKNVDFNSNQRLILYILLPYLLSCIYNTQSFASEQ